VGFYGQLSNELKQFECRANYDGVNSVQRYDLNRKSFNMKISIVPPKDVDLVPVNNQLFNIAMLRGKSINLTCVTTVGCNDYNYELRFNTNTSVSDCSSSFFLFALGRSPIQYCNFRFRCSFSLLFKGQVLGDRQSARSNALLSKLQRNV
jgi:hypothetical protein